MTEIELFFKIVESEMRRKHIKYLKKQKCLPSDQTTPKQEEEGSTVSPAADIDDFVYADKPKKKEKVKRVKAFNKGIETALKVVQSEYAKFKKRLDSEAVGKRKI